MEIMESNLHIVEITLNNPICWLRAKAFALLRFQWVDGSQNMAVIAAIETAVRVRRNAAESNLINVFAKLSDVGATH
jgi:hypothetical protein